MRCLVCVYLTSKISLEHLHSKVLFSLLVWEMKMNPSSICILRKLHKSNWGALRYLPRQDEIVDYTRSWSVLTWMFKMWSIRISMRRNLCFNSRKGSQVSEIYSEIEYLLACKIWCYHQTMIKLSDGVWCVILSYHSGFSERGYDCAHFTNQGVCPSEIGGVTSGHTVMESDIAGREISLWTGLICTMRQNSSKGMNR